MSVGPYRLPTGGAIDRAQALSFRFDGTSLTGFAGDTLASALLANGHRVVGRSFKYHRPRGVLTAGPEEPNALVELRSGARREPNTKATTAELFDGLEAASQNRWPSLRFDIGAAARLAGSAASAGFYYKTFMWPAAFWEKVYEPAIRRAAGLGRASGVEDPDTYEKAFAFCDVLVIGGGPAGLIAALTAGRSGARVILCDEDFVLGGRLNAERTEIDGQPAAIWAAAIATELEALPNVRVMRRTAVVGVYDGGTYAALERVADHLLEPPFGQPRQRFWRIVAKTAVLATGAVERPIVFGGNDKPGVMMAGAVRTYLNRFSVAPGRRVAFFANNDDAWTTAADLRAAGVDLVAVIDSRAEVADHIRAKAGNARVELSAAVADAKGGYGLTSLQIATPKGRIALDADALAVSGGWNPQLGLATHLGGKPQWSERHAAFLLPADLPAGLTVAGAANGMMTTAEALADGAAKGATAADAAGFTAAPAPLPRASDESFAVAPLWQVAASRTKAFVDFQNDVTASDLALSVREGFTSVEHLKRYTTLGMATDQGRTSNVNGLAMLAALTGRGIAETGATRARPPERPVAFGALAGLHRGKHLKPTRLTPSHRWAASEGAVFIEAGPWLRAQWYPRPGEKTWLDSVSREAAAVRSAVGICDVSTLGKIALFGRDVGAFLDRVYCNTFSTLPVGKLRYGLMLREDGFVMDDGTTARLSENEWVMSTTTANAAKVMHHLELARQVLWPQLDVRLASVTEQWAQFAIAGPNARALLERLLGDVSDEVVPYLAARIFDLGGIPARLFRVSFSGERAYEIAVPAQYGDALAHELMWAGEGLGVTPYGTEALGVLRIEKGHVAGNELNGQTTARDLGLGKMMSAKKDYIGRVMAARPALIDPDRPMLAGFRAVDPTKRPRAGAHFLKIGAPETPENDEGYLTSVAFSPALNRWIGLGFIKRGPERVGERIRAYDRMQGGDLELEICAPVFVDPEGTRVHG
ncbi:Sarcosine oxidase subunit alpha [Alphaproteobacteria bacterium SO-S41]|nr:Sarcosine oxidase subunit alpha [Alphaproteobacteria bacterium SO-S41]